jgi:cytochrome c553
MLTIKWVRIVIAIAAWSLVASGLFIAGVYGASEWKMARRYDTPLRDLPTISAFDPEQAERMARIVGCWAGCHGTKGEGGVEEIPGIRRITAPTLSDVLPGYSDAELLRLILYGVKRDGRSAIGMSSFTFWSVGDADIANIIHFLRRQPAVEPVPRAIEIPFRSRLGLLQGRWKLSADQVDKSQPRWGNMPRESSYERGRFLAAIVCAECHGVDYQGDSLEGGPSLAILSTYDAEEFSTLMKSGWSQADRLVERMAWLPDIQFTDQDIADLYSFLQK